MLLLTSDKSLEGKLLNNLPELPLRTTRMFSTKALKQQTQKKVNNLTEVQQKKKDENLKNLKRKNRLMTEIFNKVNKQKLLSMFRFHESKFDFFTELTTKRPERKSQPLEHRKLDLQIALRVNNTRVLSNV